MKPTLRCCAALLAWLSTLNPQFSTVFAQGSLTPPGVPGPTMITLSQIEPRTPISSAPFTITNPGSYYLTTNLNVGTNDAIDINANEVTLDLAGFTISSTAPVATGDGILISICTNVTIFNGHIRGGVTNNGSGVFSGGGFANGIYANGYSFNVYVSGVTVSGCLDSGIFLHSGPTGASTIIESCATQDTGYYALAADTVCRSTVSSGYEGIAANVVSDCYAYCYSSAVSGNWAVNNCVGQSTAGGGITSSGSVNNCYGSSSTSYGISGEAVHNCTGVSGGNQDGIQAQVVTDSTGSSNGSVGIEAYETASGSYAYSGSGTPGVFALYTQNASFCTAYHNGGAAISATLANGCYAQGGTNQITYKYNMP